jgi:hypothetical protein
LDDVVYYCYYDSVEGYKWTTDDTKIADATDQGDDIDGNLRFCCEGSKKVQEPTSTIPSVATGICCSGKYQQYCTACLPGSTKCNMCGTVNNNPYSVTAEGTCYAAGACDLGYEGQRANDVACDLGTDTQCCFANCAANPTQTSSACCPHDQCWDGLTCANSLSPNLPWKFLCTAEDTWTECTQTNVCNKIAAADGNDYYCRKDGTTLLWVTSNPGGSACDTGKYCEGTTFTCEVCDPKPESCDGVCPGKGCFNYDDDCNSDGTTGRACCGNGVIDGTETCGSCPGDYIAENGGSLCPTGEYCDASGNCNICGSGPDSCNDSCDSVFTGSDEPNACYSYDLDCDGADGSTAPCWTGVTCPPDDDSKCGTGNCANKPDGDPGYDTSCCELGYCFDGTLSPDGCTQGISSSQKFLCTAEDTWIKCDENTELCKTFTAVDGVEHHCVLDGTNYKWVTGRHDDFDPYACDPTNGKPYVGCTEKSHCSEPNICVDSDGDNQLDTCISSCSANYNGKKVDTGVVGLTEVCCSSNVVLSVNYECSYNPSALGDNCRVLETTPGTYISAYCTEQCVLDTDTETGLYCTKKDDQGQFVCLYYDEESDSYSHSHCYDPVLNCGEVSLNVGGDPVCAGECFHQGSEERSEENCLSDRTWCNEVNQKTLPNSEEYCVNCGTVACGDGLANCAEVCDPTDLGSRCGPKDTEYEGKYCDSGCSYQTDYSPESPYCMSESDGGFGCADPDGDIDRPSCDCKGGVWAGDVLGCCGDDAGESWMDLGQNWGIICEDADAKICEGYDDSGQTVEQEGVSYYCVVQEGVWGWSTNPCAEGDLHCYDAPTCLEIEQDSDCKYENDNTCTKEYECMSSFCKSDPDQTVTGCCNNDQCWNGERCVNEGGVLDSGYVCSIVDSVGTWVSCTADDKCEISGGNVCLLEEEIYGWSGLKTLGEQCDVCDSACLDGTCCESGSCGLTSGEICNSNDDECCSGNCVSGHCCAQGKVWCGTSCQDVVDITDPTHDCSTCPAQPEIGNCPLGYICTDGTCEPPGSCSSSLPCSSPFECASDTAGNLAKCCLSGYCWDESTEACVESGDKDSSGISYCDEGIWGDYCTDQLNPQGKCDVECGAETGCDAKEPGKDYSTYACKLDCTKTTARFDLTAEQRICETDSVSGCLDQDADASIITVDQGVMILLSYEVEYNGAPTEADVRIYVDDTLVEDDEGSTGGNYALTELSGGTHNVRVAAASPDFIDDEVEFTIKVTPNFASAISFILSPSTVSVLPGIERDMSLTVVNDADYAYDVTISTNLATNLPSTGTIPKKATVPFSFKLKTPTELGAHDLIITLTSEKGTAEVKGVVSVHEKQFFDVNLVPEFSTAGWKVKVTNAGTASDEYTLTHCLGSDRVSLEPGEEKEINVGQISTDCKFTAQSSDVKKDVSLKPVSLLVGIPPTIIANLAETNTFTFRTGASEEGTITVRSDSKWFPQFTCSSNCERELNFVPENTGDYNVKFTVSWDKYKLTSTAVTRISVGQQINLVKDAAEITSKITQLEVELNQLNQEGIQAPAAKVIIDRVKATPATTTEEVAQVLGQLQQAERFLNYARETEMPTPREFPITYVVIGGVAVIVGLVAAYLAFFHENSPFHESAKEVQHTFHPKPEVHKVKTEVHHEHHEKAPSAKLHVGPDARTYNVPPGGKLVKLPNGQMLVVPAGMKVVKTDQGQYKLAHQ